MIYIEISCLDCKQDVGYGKAINSDGSPKTCPHCGSDNLHEFSYYDD